jgi:hypothetical protein
MPQIALRQSSLHPMAAAGPSTGPNARQRKLGDIGRKARRSIHLRKIAPPASGAHSPRRPRPEPAHSGPWQRDMPVFDRGQQQWAQLCSCTLLTRRPSGKFGREEKDGTRRMVILNSPLDRASAGPPALTPSGPAVLSPPTPSLRLPPNPHARITYLTNSRSQAICRSSRGSNTHENSLSKWGHKPSVVPPV